jgi:acyl-CoA synthetase (NDP forming)
MRCIILTLDRLFKPRSIAVIGASNDEYKAGYQIVSALADFPGALYPINPHADEILGFKVYPTLSAVGKPVDLVILSIPAAGCADVLIEAGETGAGGALIISGGFGETGDEGKSVQDEIVSVCRRYGMRLLGPNTAGFRNPKAGVTANFAPWIGELKAGPVGVVSQSGAINLILAAAMHNQGLGISLATGIGNGVDVGVADVVEYLAEDAETKVIALYLEGVSKGGRRLYEVLCRAVEKKPVVVFPVGQADISDFAVSHTGNLMGSFALKKAALIQAGAVVVSSSNDLVDAAKVLSKVRLKARPNPGVGLLTGQAGPGMVIADYLRSHAINLPKLSASTIKRISELIPPMTFIKNPVDTGRPGPAFREVLLAMAKDSAIDVLVTFAIHEPAVIDPVALFREMKEEVEQPLVFGTAGFSEHVSPTQKALEAIQVASFVSPDRTARATRALIEDAKAAYRKTRPGQDPAGFPEMDPIESVPDESVAKSILETLGIRTPSRVVCGTHEEAKTALHNLGGPCAVKILSPGIIHKTDVGGVHLNVRTEEQLLSALEQIDAVETRGERGYLIEEMAPEGLEIIIGAADDPGFGPTVLLGLGGTAAEALNDVVMRLAPLGLFDALDMIAELKSSALFDGWRGGPAYDKKAAAETLVKIGHFINHHPEIQEMDLNPVRVHEKGLTVLDAVIVCE